MSYPLHPLRLATVCALHGSSAPPSRPWPGWLSTCSAREPFRRGTGGAPHGMSNDSVPFENANEADVAEQQQAMDGAGTVDEQTVAPDSAAEADVLEQGATVAGDDGS